MVCHYAPHGEYSTIAKECHWGLLNTIIEELDKRNPKLVIGDCNARLHGRRDYETDVIGPVIFGRGVAYLEKMRSKYKENKEFLVSFCREHDLKIMNTWRLA